MAEVESQIQQMVQFIKQEAKEKAAEIKLKADEEYNIQKLRAVEDEKQKIRGDYERKEKQVEVQKRIAQSNEVRLGRMKTLKAREEAMQAVLAEAAAKLPSLTQGSGYATLLESLILEALIELCDQKVQVKGIASAAAITQKAMTPAVAKYKEWATKSQGAAWASTIEVTFDSTPLTSGIGGVAVSGFGGKITLTNTLESRLMLAYETRLPELRRVLFA
jgi:V-type H+-transporting ATPase subunit E